MNEAQVAAIQALVAQKQASIARNLREARDEVVRQQKKVRQYLAEQQYYLDILKELPCSPE